MPKAFLRFIWPLAFAVAAASAADPSSVQILDRAHSVINGELSVVDYQGVRLLVASAPQGVAIQSFLDLRSHPRLIEPYTQLVSMVTALHPSPMEAYNMGLGGGALPKFHLAQYPKSRVDSVEIDPAMIQLAKKDFFVVTDRHTIIEGDGFETLEHQQKKYDIIWMDQFTPKEGPKATVSAQYLQILRDHLKPDGVLVVHLGPAKSAKTFSLSIQGYRSGFTNAVRIEGPAPSFAKSNFDPMPALNAVALNKKQNQDPALHLPEHVIAVSNNTTLNCARFWEIYQRWSKERLTDLHWTDQSRTAGCEDLK